MRRTDKRRARAHLNEAVRHLAIARVVIQDLDADAEISDPDRTELGDITSVVRSLAGQVDDALQGRVLDLELADMLAMPTDDGCDPA